MGTRRHSAASILEQQISVNVSSSEFTLTRNISFLTSVCHGKSAPPSTFSSGSLCPSTWRTCTAHTGGAARTVCHRQRASTRSPSPDLTLARASSPESVVLINTLRGRRQHPSEYVSIREHTQVAESHLQHTSASVSIREHTCAYAGGSVAPAAYVSIREHT
jgi:hypothetical protein